jgi:spiro-SPASM protein
MKNIAIVNGIGLRPPASRPLVNGTTSLARALEFARGLPETDEVVLLLSRPLAEASPCTVSVRDSWTVATLLDEISRRAESAGADNVFYFYADCPFLDIGITQRMHANHRQYWADYTFADGYPYGLTPEILTRETVSRLRGLAGEGTAAPQRDSVFSLIRKDINSFDIETVISPADLRLLRVSLSADTERNFVLLSRIVEGGARDAESICRFLSEQPRSLRTLPAFFPIQIVERCPQACAYCPYPQFGGNILSRAGFMSVESFSVLIRKIARFCGDAVVDVSLWGEPSLHPSIFEMVGTVLREPGVDLLIETSGIGWPAGSFSRIKESFDRQPTWIVSLDASTEEMYRKLRGPGFDEARRSAEELLALFPGTAWVQAVRMKENEDDLDLFFKTWKARTENVIIQKYDCFSSMLPDRKVADLSPVKRFPCWHLKRDMAVLVDGTVPLCREDVRVATFLGNALTEDLGVIWSRAQETYHSHAAGEYPGICARCDEYYTYNF